MPGPVKLAGALSSFFHENSHLLLWSVLTLIQLLVWILGSPPLWTFFHLIVKVMDLLLATSPLLLSWQGQLMDYVLVPSLYAYDPFPTSSHPSVPVLHLRNPFFLFFLMRRYSTAWKELDNNWIKKDINQNLIVVKFMILFVLLK